MDRSTPLSNSAGYRSMARPCQEQPLTLSNIIPPPEQARSISESSMIFDDLEDESVLKSIYAKLLGHDAPTTRVRVNSGSGVHRRNCGSMCKDMSRHRVSALLDLTLLMKSVGVSSSAVIVLPATQDVFPIAGTNQSSALLPSRSTAMSSTVALLILSTMACPVFVSARHQKICRVSRCL